MKSLKPLLITILIVFSFSACSLLFDTETVASNPTINYSSLNSPTLITLSTETEGATIHFTLDGTDPDTNIYNFFGSTYIYTEPFYLYEPTTIKVVASKSSLDDSDIIEKTINITPVRLSKGETHNFDGLEITLNDIFWYKYENLYGTEIETDCIAFEFAVKNNTGKTLYTNTIYAWGNIIEYPSINQLNQYYYGALYDTNMTVYSGSSLLPSANITTSTYFNEVASTSTNFKFVGKPLFKYESTIGNNAGYYFEIVFNRTDINTKPIL